MHCVRKQLGAGVILRTDSVTCCPFGTYDSLSSTFFGILKGSAPAIGDGDPKKPGLGMPSGLTNTEPVLY